MLMPRSLAMRRLMRRVAKDPTADDSQRELAEEIARALQRQWAEQLRSAWGAIGSPIRSWCASVIVGILLLHGIASYLPSPNTVLVAAGPIELQCGLTVFDLAFALVVPLVATPWHRWRFTQTQSLLAELLSVAIVAHLVGFDIVFGHVVPGR
jgi:hypothetical protein